MGSLNMIESNLSVTLKRSITLSDIVSKSANLIEETRCCVVWSVVRIEDTSYEKHSSFSPTLVSSSSHSSREKFSENTQEIENWQNMTNLAQKFYKLKFLNDNIKADKEQSYIECLEDIEIDGTLPSKSKRRFLLAGRRPSSMTYILIH